MYMKNVCVKFDFAKANLTKNSSNKTAYAFKPNLIARSSKKKVKKPTKIHITPL